MPWILSIVQDSDYKSIRDGYADARREVARSGGMSNRRLPVPKNEIESSLKDFRRTDESSEDATARFKSISKKNIATLLKWRPATATEIGVEARWLRRLQQQGLGFYSKATKVNAEKIADFFGLPHPTYLWRDDLLTYLGLPEPTPKQVSLWTGSRHWRHAETLLELLDTGKYDHLIGLISDLRELETHRVSKEAGKPKTTGKTLGEIVKKKMKKTS